MMLIFGSDLVVYFWSMKNIIIVVVVFDGDRSGGGRGNMMAAAVMTRRVDFGSVTSNTENGLNLFYSIVPKSFYIWMDSLICLKNCFQKLCVGT